jgi:hypothetical protein
MEELGHAWSVDAEGATRASGAQPEGERGAEAGGKWEGRAAAGRARLWVSPARAEHSRTSVAEGFAGVSGA